LKQPQKKNEADARALARGRSDRRRAEPDLEAARAKAALAQKRAQRAAAKAASLERRALCGQPPAAISPATDEGADRSGSSESSSQKGSESGRESDAEQSVEMKKQSQERESLGNAQTKPKPAELRRRGKQARSVSVRSSCERRGEAESSSDDAGPPGSLQWWPRASDEHSAGYKLVLKNVPISYGYAQIHALLESAHCARKIRLEDPIVSRRSGRKRYCLTFKSKGAARHAFKALKGAKFEGLLSKTGWWRSRDFP